MGQRNELHSQSHFRSSARANQNRLRRIGNYTKILLKIIRQSRGIRLNRGMAISATRTYRIWNGMKQRLRRDRGYENVQLHPAWQKFSPFLKDMGECPPGYSLDRVDPRGNYEPSNCRWIPRELQSRTTKKYLDGGPCIDCQQKRGNRNGRCGTCYEYFRRNKIPRPTDTEILKSRKGIAIAKKHARTVIQMTADGQFIREWESGFAASRALGLHHSNVSKAVKGHTKLCGGFKWAKK